MRQNGSNNSNSARRKRSNNNQGSSHSSKEDNNFSHETKTSPKKKEVVIHTLPKITKSNKKVKLPDVIPLGLQKEEEKVTDKKKAFIQEYSSREIILITCSFLPQIDSLSFLSSNKFLYKYSTVIPLILKPNIPGPFTKNLYSNKEGITMGY